MYTVAYSLKVSVHGSIVNIFKNSTIKNFFERHAIFLRAANIFRPSARSVNFIEAPFAPIKVGANMNL